jgi:flagellar motility protein MotE (MotC chaperone)
MAKRKPNGMTRAQAAKLYDDLKASLEKRHGKQRIAKLMQEEAKKQGAARSKVAGLGAAVPPVSPMSPMPSSPGSAGSRMAILFVVLFATAKIVFAVLEAAGIAKASPALASQIPANYSRPAEKYSKDELQVLKSLDARRVELEERDKRLDKKESEMKQRDREFAARLSEIRDISQKLKSDREKNERKKTAQLEQLANVYSSMNPEESAKLIEQLDVTISLQLIERMPEKRIGQILSMMSPERALTLTQMLSH